MDEITIRSISAVEGYIKIEYAYGSEIRESIVLTSNERARVEFYEAWKTLCLAVKEEYTLTDRQFTLDSVKFSWESKEMGNEYGRLLKYLNVTGFTEKNGYQYMKVAMKINRGWWGILKVNQLKHEKQSMAAEDAANKFDEMIHTMCREAVYFIKGKRAQTELFDEEEGDEE